MFLKTANQQPDYEGEILTTAAILKKQEVQKLKNTASIAGKIRFLAEKIIFGQENLQVGFYDLFCQIERTLLEKGALAGKKGLRSDFFINTMVASYSGLALVTDGEKRFFTPTSRIRLIRPLRENFWKRYEKLSPSPYLLTLVLIQNMLENQPHILAREGINELHEKTGVSKGFALSSLASPRSGLVIFSDGLNTFITRTERVRLLA